MHARPEVLCFGADPALNRTRRLILERAFDVRAASTLPEVASWLQERRFAVILLCQTLSLDDAQSAMELARALNPEARLLALEEGNPRLFLRDPHQEVRLDGPADLLRTVASLAGVRLPEPAPVLPPTASRKVPPRAD